MSEFEGYDDEAIRKQLGPTEKGRSISLPNLTPEENAKIGETLVTRPGGPKIPDFPDIAEPPPDLSEAVATDAEFFVGGRYKPHGRKSKTGVTFEVVQHPKEPQHRAFDEDCAARAKIRGAEAPRPSFYVQTPRGTVGWVPWIGSVVAWPWERAWTADLVEHGAADPKPGTKK